MAKSKKSKISERKATVMKPAATESTPITIKSQETEDPPKQQQRQQTPTPPPKIESIDGSFGSFYLREVTREFADELDKIRKASDFKEKSLPILVATLKQGASLYGEEERRSWVAHS